ncbi:unnamed protein product [Mytilus coruscus]|uniref:Uncharacterized protein n=1 Tax=Mytilus coruscus TaxID=42192 RepID=A0A6J8DV90_MYTCO|nr:unnamed protein product [Mytilus coruscus]
MVSTITEKFFRENLMNKYELYESTKYLKLRAANGLDIPYIGYIETDIFVPSLKKTIEDRGILIVKDVHDSNDNISGILGMNVVNQCMGLLQSEIGPLYIKELKKNEAMINWVRAFRECTNSNITGFARISGNMDVCIPANSVSVVNVIGPTQKLPAERPIIVELLTNDTDFIVVNSLSESSRHTYPVRIANLKTLTFGLKRNRKIGIIREVNVLPEVNNEIEFLAQKLMKKQLFINKRQPDNDISQSESSDISCNSISVLPKYTPEDIKNTQMQDPIIKRFLCIILKGVNRLDWRGSVSRISNEESDNESDEDDPIAIGYEGSQPSVAVHVQMLNSFKCSSLTKIRT